MKKMPKNDADYCQMLSFAFDELARAKRAAKRRTAENKTLRRKVNCYEGRDVRGDLPPENEEI